MAIINTEKGASRPICSLLEFGLNNVQDYWHSVLIIVPDDALVSIGCIGYHHSVPLTSIFSRLVTRKEWDRRVKLYLISNGTCWLSYRLVHLGISKSHLSHINLSRQIMRRLLSKLMLLPTIISHWVKLWRSYMSFPQRIMCISRPLLSALVFGWEERRLMLRLQVGSQMGWRVSLRGKEVVAFE